MAEGSLVRFENVVGIGLIRVDNRPVDALSPGIPEGPSGASGQQCRPGIQGDGVDRRRPEVYSLRRYPPVRHPPSAAP
jgi:hypothetical protein